MKNRLKISGVLFAMALAGAGCTAEKGDAATRVASGETEVVVSSAAMKSLPAVRFAAEEMTNFLSRVFGAPVPLVTAPRAGRTSIVLGTNEWSEAAGVAVADLPRDASVLSVLPNRIFIAGRDDPKFVPFKGEYDKEIGTLYGVYSFLERYAGCRFYFPGELGEITPRRNSFEVPTGALTDSPDWKIRRISHRLGAWFEPLASAAAFRNDRLFRYRMRVQTEGIPCCHGLELMNYSLRFGKTNPEYFRLRNGKRDNVWVPYQQQWRHSMLCYSSGIWEEIYKDALSYFRGEGPEVRGIRFGSRSNPNPRCMWGWNVSAGKYFDAMPQDGMGKCECPNCQEAYAKARNPRDWANEMIWGETVRLANRLKEAGIDGKITQMAYHPYRDVPEIDIPENVLVMVCSNGSWVRPERLEEDIAVYKAWYAKRNGNIWVWNNCGKHGCFDLDITDLPSVTPKSFGEFYRRIGPIVFGAYCSNNAERFLYSALNYYVFSHIAWDNDTDVDTLLDEYYRNMFGAAEKPMRQVFEMIERKWMEEVLGHAIETPIGTKTTAPTTFAVWTKIYTAEDVRVMKEFFSAAASAVPAGSLEARRVALMKREFLDPIVRRTAMYLPGAAEREESRRAAAGDAAVLLSVPEVKFEVTEAMRDKEVYDRRFPLDVKPGKTYRVSYFLTCDDVRPYPLNPKASNFLRRSGGVQCVVQMARAPKSSVGGIGSGVEGSFKRTLQEYEVTIPEKFPENASPQLVVRMYKRTGSAHFGSIRVEEVVK